MPLITAPVCVVAKCIREQFRTYATRTYYPFCREHIAAMPYRIANRLIEGILYRHEADGAALYDSAVHEGLDYFNGHPRAREAQEDAMEIPSLLDVGAFRDVTLVNDPNWSDPTDYSFASKKLPFYGLHGSGLRQQSAPNRPPKLVS